MAYTFRQIVPYRQSGHEWMLGFLCRRHQIPRLSQSLITRSQKASLAATLRDAINHLPVRSRPTISFVSLRHAKRGSIHTTTESLFDCLNKWPRFKWRGSTIDVVLWRCFMSRRVLIVFAYPSVWGVTFATPSKLTQELNHAQRIAFITSDSWREDMCTVYCWHPRDFSLSYLSQRTLQYVALKGMCNYFHWFTELQCKMH